MSSILETNNKTPKLNKKIFCLIGPSASGKATLLKEVLKNSSLNKVIPYTTRSKRIGEKDLKDYIFISNNVFEQMFLENKTIAIRQYNSKEGILTYFFNKDSFKSSVSNDLILIIDVIGYKELKSKLQDTFSIYSIYIDCRESVRERRSYQRDLMTNDKIKEIERRILSDRDDVLPYKEKCDYILKNENDEDLKKNIDFIINQLCKNL